MSLLSSAFAALDMFAEEERRRHAYEKVRDHHLAEMAREMHVDLGEGDRTVRVLGVTGPSGPLLITSVEVSTDAV